MWVKKGYMQNLEGSTGYSVKRKNRPNGPGLVFTTVVGQGVAQEPRPPVLDCLDEGAVFWGDDGRAAQPASTFTPQKGSKYRLGVRRQVSWLKKSPRSRPCRGG